MDGDPKKTTLDPAACSERSRTDDKRGLECRHCGCFYPLSGDSMLSGDRLSGDGYPGTLSGDSI